MISNQPAAPGSRLIRIISLWTAMALFAAPLSAQQRRTPAPVKALPTFDGLLSADAYEVYGEVRNVGQLLSTGGAGEIADPIMKLAEPPKEFQSIIKFLKTNSEALATARLLFATSPARTEIPATFVAVEFSSPEEAEKFAPRLEKFLPQILPPVPDATPTPDAKPAKLSELGPQPAKPIENEAQATPDAPVATLRVSPVATIRAMPVATPVATPAPVAEHLPFVITHSGNLVCISDKPFKFEKLHPTGSKPLAEDQNFRIAHDRFPSESVFLFFNVALQSRAKPQPSPKQQITEEEAERRRQGVEQRRVEAEAEMARAASAEPSPAEPQISEGRATLRAPRVVLGTAEPSPTPTPTKEQQAQIAASSQIGHMLDLLGRGEPQWPEAIGVALTFDNDEYVIRAILVESQNAKRLTLPFVPQLISGPAYIPNAPSVLPDDTEVFVSASIDFSQTHEGMRKQAELAAKTEQRLSKPAGEKEETLDTFAAFEKKAGFKIKEDLLPVMGNEIALAGSLKTLEGFGMFGVPASRSSPKASPESADAKEKAAENFPVLLISIKDREAARPLLPRIFDGLGIGEANLIAQTEKRGDTELVNYGGVFAYAFVGDFLVISEAAAVRRVIEANVNHQTLSSNSAFRNFRRWQPRQILGEVYVSPALMQGYQDEIRKQSATMDEKMRDFLMQLSPTANAISYALTNEGFGEVHELHLPKNLIIAMVAGTTAAMSAMKQGSPEMNEMMAESLLRMISSAEATYQATAGNGSYGSLDQLVEAKLLGPKEMFDMYGYKFEVTASGDHFEASATPVEYGKTGKRSFFVDQSGVVRGDDHNGGPANVMDKPAQGP
ncbi:MAG TPA: hypothetical protein VK117_09185 [Pyrinomonadaceae bacterium]|nr:hypothetical protein [Pyrinomonadaceae bacterium]